MSCSICVHDDCLAIEQDLCSEPIAWGTLRLKYGVHHLALMRHRREHMKPAALATDNMPMVEKPSQKNADQLMPRVEETAKPAALTVFGMPPRIGSIAMVTENPESQFKQAWQLAKDDQRMRDRMVAWLNDQLQADEVGDTYGG